MSTSQRPVTIYISAASDLMAEREALARTIAALPVTLAWRIIQTPVTNADLLDLEGLESSDIVLLLMGSDIRAPVGLEWLMARRALRPAVAYLKRGVSRTPAGRVFVNDAEVVWQAYQDVADLCHQVQSLLAKHLLKHATRYALTPDEAAALESLPPSDTSSEQALHGEEAGHSAVIISPERFEPSEGVAMGEATKP